MVELRKILISYLKSIHPRVYFQSVPDNTLFPYLVFDIPNIIDDGEYLEMAVIDIDGWGNSADTTALENLMIAINNGLNKKTLTAENIAVTFYLDVKIPLRDEDQNIRRRKYTYQAKIFKKG